MTKAHFILSIFTSAICLFAASNFVTAQDQPHGKCAFIFHPRTEAPGGIDARVSLGAVRPMRQTSVRSSRGHFRIHYDTIGINTPALLTQDGLRIEGTFEQYVDSVTNIFETVWDAEVTTLGFPAPAPGQGEHGGDEIDIYIGNLPPTIFGGTTPDAIPGSQPTQAPKCICYTEIDNDYLGYRTSGISGLMVTAAHEFFHVIQASRYGYWGDERYFYELTAESMEHIVFPSVNDYIFDLADYFMNIDRLSLYSPFSQSPGGYERAIWSLFLIQRHGIGILREIFEATETMKPIPAMTTVLQAHSTTLAREFSEFCYWNYFTGPRADSTRFYPDAHLFPVVAIRERQDLFAGPVTFQKKCLAFGVNYLQAVNGYDTASCIVVNVNMDDALMAHSTALPIQQFDYHVSATPIADGSHGTGNASMSIVFSANDAANWTHTTLYNNHVQNIVSSYCFPNPLRAGQGEMYFSANKANARQTAQTLTVLSSGSRVIFTGQVALTSHSGSDFAVWDGKDAQGRPLASGVYVYALSNGDDLMRGKFAVIR
jgi:hypothetical protein